MTYSDVSSLLSVSGKRLKVVIEQFEPATMIIRNATGHATEFEGFMYEQLAWLSIRLNFSLAMETSTEIFGSILSNGTMSGIGGKLQREEVDLACIPFTLMAIRPIAIQLAVYVLGDGFSILEKYPEPISSMYGMFITFSLNIWIGLVLTIISVIAAIYLLMMLKRKYFTNIYKSSSNKSLGGNFKSDYRPVGVIAFTWCLFAFFIVNIYSSCVTSYTSLKFQRPDVQTFQDVASDSRYQVLTVESSFPDRMFKQAVSGAMKEIGDKRIHCAEECGITNLIKDTDKVLGGKHVAILSTVVCNKLMLKTMVNHHQCRLTVAKETMSFQHMYMGAPSTSPYVMELNKESLWWHSYGLSNYWDRKLAPRAEQCRLDYNSAGESVKVAGLEPLKLKQFYLAFLLLILGYLLALIVFMMERTLSL